MSAGAFGFTYDALSRRMSLTRPTGGLVTNYSYDQLSRLLSVLHQSGSTTVDGTTYQYDYVANRTSATNLRPSPSVTSNYYYDLDYELTKVMQGATETEAYGYDNVGNRTSSLTVPQYNYNTSNELTSTSTGNTYSYDNNGNLKTRMDSTETTTYTWDFENRLTNEARGSWTAVYKYDPFGRRIYENAGPHMQWIYVYDGDNLFERLDLTGVSQRKFTMNLGIDDPLATYQAITSGFYDADGLGSITSVSNNTGALLSWETYDSFGNLTATYGSLATQFLFTGREYDAPNEYFYRARYYDPVLGRFISEDPIRYGGGSLNFYAYVGSDPVDYVDPFGTAPTCGKPQCFAQLKYRLVDNWFAKMLGRTHAFWYVQGSSGVQYILSGGPSNPNGTGSLNVGLNPNVTGGVDNTSGTVSWKTDLSSENCKGVDAMTKAAKAWPNNTLPYHPVEGPNSDTAAHALGTAGGFNPPPPPGTTGWNTPLPH